MRIHRIFEQITLPVSTENLWEFISDPRNLKVITPEYMGFEILSPALAPRIYPGMIISYRVAPLLGIPMTWVTEITQVRELSYFVDEQRVGPYVMWHHEHHLEHVPEGVRMTDMVTYRLPLGFLGNWVHRLWVRKQLNRIFNYRREVLVKKFGNE